MKKYILISLLSFSFKSNAQIVKVGDLLPDYQFEKVINYSKSTLNLRETKDKILIVEFWGTWCGPCIPALEHLDELQKKFKNDVIVVGISDDTEERLNKFLLKRPVGIPLVSDPMNKSYKFFKVPAVPRTFISNRKGEIVSITHPSEITEESIKQLILGQKVQFKQEEDKNRNIGKQDYFGADLKTDFAFTMKPMIDTMPTMILQKWGNHLFEGRRLSFINVTTDFFIRNIFQKSNPETLILTDKKQFEFKPENRFCFDIIVSEEDKSKFYSIAQDEIQRRLKYKIYTEKRETEVYILKKDSDSINLKISNLPPRRSSSSEKRRRISVEGKGIDELVDFLNEQYGNSITVDETGLKDKYDYSLDWQKRTELLEELKKIGLTLEKANRPVEMLIIADK
jgi:thiol-disulfide isomerase/thioredoxin